MDKKLSVIVADDDTLSVRGLLSELRRMRNIDPVIPLPRNGEEVLTLFEDKQYDFIFLDYLMPKMDGLETAMVMKKAQVKTHVIFHSEVASAEDIKKILRMGYHVWIEKNCNYLNVHQAIEAAMAGRAFLPDKINSLLLEMISVNNNTPGVDEVQLTKTEVEILIEMIKCTSSEEIAKKRNVSISTVNSHRHNIHEKTLEQTVYGLLCYAIEHKLIKPNDFFSR